MRGVVGYIVYVGYVVGYVGPVCLRVQGFHRVRQGLMLTGFNRKTLLNMNITRF